MFLNRLQTLFRTPRKVGRGPIELDLVQGNIVHQAVDAIVNAADETLLGGTGVDGAIHEAAGPALFQATRALGRCRTGDAKITPGFNLPARWVVHAVAPVYSGGSRSNERLLESAYTQALRVADAQGVRSIAFPCLGTGAFGWPPREAAALAIGAIRNTESELGSIERIVLVVFSPFDRHAYERALGRKARVELPETALQYHPGMTGEFS